MLSTRDKIIKRIFDVMGALVALFLTGWLVLLAWFIASIETKSNGLFMQIRIGKKAKPFLVFKIKTMTAVEKEVGSITALQENRITKSGMFFRRTKIDELPQLLNVLFGTMSFVGPRPDVEGYADKLQGEDRVILEVRPGITGPASIRYKNEEDILRQVDNVQAYNDTVIWSDKVALNKVYVETWTFKKDMLYILETLRG